MLHKYKIRANTWSTLSISDPLFSKPLESQAITFVNCHVLFVQTKMGDLQSLTAADTAVDSDGLRLSTMLCGKPALFAKVVQCRC